MFENPDQTENILTFNFCFINETSKGMASEIRTLLMNFIARPVLTVLFCCQIEFGGWLGALVQIVGFVVLIGSVLLGCTKDQCLLQSFHIPRNPRVYFNVQSAIAVVGFFTLQALLSALPIGRIVKTPPGTATYRANGNYLVVVPCTYPLQLNVTTDLPCCLIATLSSGFLIVCLFFKTVNK